MTMNELRLTVSTAALRSAASVPAQGRSVLSARNKSEQKRFISRFFHLDFVKLSFSSIVCKPNFHQSAVCYHLSFIQTTKHRTADKINLTVCVVSDGSVYGPAGEEEHTQRQRLSFSIQMLAERLLMNMKKVFSAIQQLYELPLTLAEKNL